MTTDRKTANLIARAAREAHEAVAELLKAHPDGHRLALDALLRASASFALSHRDTIDGRDPIGYAQATLARICDSLNPSTTSITGFPDGPPQIH